MGKQLAEQGEPFGYAIHALFAVSEEMQDHLHCLAPSPSLSLPLPLRTLSLALSPRSPLCLLASHSPASP